MQNYSRINIKSNSDTDFILTFTRLGRNYLFWCQKCTGVSERWVCSLHKFSMSIDFRRSMKAIFSLKCSIAIDLSKRVLQLGDSCSVLEHFRTCVIRHFEHMYSSEHEQTWSSVSNGLSESSGSIRVFILALRLRICSVHPFHQASWRNSRGTRVNISFNDFGPAFSGSSSPSTHQIFLLGQQS